MARDPKSSVPESLRASSSGGDASGALYEGIALPVLVIDRETWNIVAVNEAALAQYGYTREEFVGLPVLSVRPPEGQDDARRILSEAPHGTWRTTGVEHCRRDGSRFRADVWAKDTEMDGHPVRVCTIHEVTTRVRLEAELQRVQRMELVGRLVGGVAHDFNNALGVILGSCDLLEEKLEDREGVEELRDIREAGRRAAAMTRQLLAFGRQQVLRPERTRLNEVVSRLQALLGGVLAPGIELRVRTEPHAWPVDVDVAQLELAVMNLVLNAAEAMPAGGTLTLATQRLSLGSDTTANGVLLPSGDYAGLVVQDSGIGMDALTLRRAFEPFFTTHGPAARKGLGLAMTYGIVRQSGGYITVESAPGRGTTFHLLFPRAGSMEDTGPSKPPVGPRPRHTVVVLGDSSDVLRTTLRVLDGMGVRTVSARTVEETLDAARKSGHPPDLAVVDLADERPDRSRTTRELVEAFPEIQFLFLSGYSADFGGHGDALDHRVGFLPRPYSADSLTAMVRKMLTGS